MARSGAAGTTIGIGLRFYLNGGLYDPYSVSSSTIYTSEVGGTLIITLPPVHVSIGFFDVLFSAPATLTPGTYWQEVTYVAELGMSPTTKRYSFSVTPENVAQEGGSSGQGELAIHETRLRPTWAYQVGLDQTYDVGNGMGISLTWGPASAASPSDQVYYNVYAADKRINTLDYPVAITAANTATISVPPGNMYYFAVRATEFDPNMYDITQLDQIGDGVYAYPAQQTLAADIDAYGVTVDVADTTGFPLSGFVQIDYEVLYYLYKSDTSFTIQQAGRGMYATPILPHSTGAVVKLFSGITDQNSVIVGGTAAWSKANGPPHNAAEVGQFNVDLDGYRTNATDIITTNLTASDAATINFPEYDYASYHRPSMETYFRGGCENSYAWGELNGQRGVGLQDQELSRLSMMLQTTGEPVILLKRKQTGKRCRCVSLEREHATARCEFCYGTSFEGGYDRYVNSRAISEVYTNTAGMILVRVAPLADDFKLNQNNGLMQAVELPAWTINVPTLKPFDLIVRYNQDGTEEFRYSCVTVTRSRLMFGLSGRQDMKLKRLDKTSIEYSISIK
jgi:hypothetical protein